jgi:hypothetical protein
MTKAHDWCAFVTNMSLGVRMTSGSDHIASNRLYPAATKHFQLTATEKEHLRDCTFCDAIFHFLHSSSSETNSSPAIFEVSAIKKTRR